MKRSSSLPRSTCQELSRLERRIHRCTLCPRLVRWRRAVAEEKPRRFAEMPYWGKPLAGFGDPRARLLVVGLAPAAHGGNRTGRMCTGDRSGEWLVRALHRAGFANQPMSEALGDGLELRDCYITAAVRCAPPANKPLHLELQRCRPFLLEELGLLRYLEVIVALGKISFDATLHSLRALNWLPPSRRVPFSHGRLLRLTETKVLLCSYHPSQQNTFTRRLTEPMLDRIFRIARHHLE